ncbi:hypothetical protein Ddye_024454 [Dipteronia dyeriana]|uniref:Non-haem dioxygenase N-terminal domain-containing protein n=1 Tax=Dipteronia dyeriana TaxID=168575 RepID=A0AAD9WTL8_9ROSI|nr:hypothetical protein Ddye_024454 [Dipteronia dyeriana]
MERLLSQDFMDSELQKLDHACREWGFFQLINHEVSSRLVQEVKIEIEEFFKLPLEEKNKFGPKEENVEGYVNSFVVSEDKNLNWGDRFFFTTSPPHLRKPHIIPNLPPSFSWVWISGFGLVDDDSGLVLTGFGLISGFGLIEAGFGLVDDGGGLVLTGLV